MILSDSNSGPWGYESKPAPVGGAELVLSALRLIGPATLGDIADKAGLGETVTRAHLHLLRDTGRARSWRDGVRTMWEAM